MIVGKNKIIFVFICFVNVMFGQTQTKIDSISCSNKTIIIEYPSISKENVNNYEEGYFKTINCILDTAVIIIHCGRMVHLPLTDLTDKTICSKFILGKDISIIRGYYILNESKKYFREDNYLKYGITIAYENVDETKFTDYEYFFNNIKIQ
ncbi:MAG: hypothetical protein LBV69_03375 [Bacteroidales bacterium]|jgi:hypothetical protein|nr:hypothetical protein [Bacteroidales bacterium]